MARELTMVETNVIKAIHAEVGTKAMIELLISWATIENGTPAAQAQVGAISAEVAEMDRVAKLEAQARGIEIESVKVGAEKLTPAGEKIVRGGLTEREIGMIVHIAESDYMDGDPSGTTWANCVCNSRADAALVGSLSKKGFVQCNQYGGKKTEDTISLTVRGLAAYRSARPDSQYAKDHDQMEIEQAIAERSHAYL